MDFEYEPLQVGEIRLLQLTGSPDLHCILRHVPLEQAEKYQYNALSYTWGDQNDRREVFVENHRPISSRPRLLKVCANLESALRVFLKHLQKPWNYSDVELESHMFWIDAICINQADKHERSQQIMLMRMIYQRANRLLIWLGDEYEDSKQAISIVSVIAKRKILDPLGFRIFLETYTSSPAFSEAWP